jgi:hypothetical protein
MEPSELKDVPTGMEIDPEADEQVIDQTSSDDDLANALAYAIDGSGAGVAGYPDRDVAGNIPRYSLTTSLYCIR